MELEFAGLANDAHSGDFFLAFAARVPLLGFFRSVDRRRRYSRFLCRVVGDSRGWLVLSRRHLPIITISPCRRDSTACTQLMVVHKFLFLH